MKLVKESTLLGLLTGLASPLGRVLQAGGSRPQLVQEKWIGRGGKPGTWQRQRRRDRRRGGKR